LGGHPKTIFLAMPVRQYARIPRMLRDAVISLLYLTAALSSSNNCPWRAHTYTSGTQINNTYMCADAYASYTLIRLRNDVHFVERGVKLYSLTHL